MMQKELANMPPEQRAQMEAIMKGRMGGAGGRGAAAARRSIRKTGTDKVGNWTCDKYEGYVGAEKTSEVCTVDPKALGFTAADFAVSKQFAAFFKKLMPADGRPDVRHRQRRGAGFQRRARQADLLRRRAPDHIGDYRGDQADVPDASFAAPAGYTGDSVRRRSRPVVFRPEESKAPKASNEHSLDL